MYAEELSKGQQAAQTMSNLVNSYGSEERKKFIEAMANDHRSLQQSFTRLCVDWFRKLENQSHDLRNEASVKLAKELKPVLDKNPLPFI